MELDKYAGKNIRWFIIVFLFAATALLYIDRSALGIMAPFLQKDIGWSEQQYGNINTAFMIGYHLPFMIASSGYLLAILLMHLIIPEIKPLKI